jgi:hypothetical protein
VLRDEPQYRLLFAGQLLSTIGDRVIMIVLPFAVLSVGGHVGDVAVVSAAQCSSLRRPRPAGRGVGRPA